MENELDADMYMDELFDGWLSAPSMASFLVKEPSPAASFSSEVNTGAIEPQTSNLPTQSSLTSVPQNGSQFTVAARARQRRSHTKSRLGCIGCKERKIKCSETWPSCANCTKRGRPCRYPTAVKSKAQELGVSKVVGRSVRTIQLSDTPMYSPNDMYLFHHFLVAAYPCVPYDFEDVWTKDVPAFSHHFTYLMQAMLAFSASHLATCSNDADTNVALLHRHKAIVGLEDAIARWPTASNEAHAMLATSYLLTFQSSYLLDGFLEHLHFLRGCALLSRMILDQRLEGVFSVTPNIHNAKLAILFRNSPRLDQGLVHEGLRSISAFSHVLMPATEFDIERALFAQLAEGLRQHFDPREKSQGSGLSKMNPQVSCTGYMPNPDTPLSTSTSTHVIKSPFLPSSLDTAFEDIPWETLTGIPPANAPNPQGSFNAHMACLKILATWPHEALLRLFSLTNNISNIVMCHFFAVRTLITPLFAPRSVLMTPTGAYVEWWGKIIAAVKDDETEQWTKYIEWPRTLHRCMKASLRKKRGFNFGDMYDIVVNDPDALREGRAKNVEKR